VTHPGERGDHKWWENVEGGGEMRDSSGSVGVTGGGHGGEKMATSKGSFSGDTKNSGRKCDWALGLHLLQTSTRR